MAPMIGLAVGKKAVASGPDGTVSGEETMQAYFRDDLGFASELLLPSIPGGKSFLITSLPSASLLGLDGSRRPKEGRIVRCLGGWWGDNVVQRFNLCQC